MRLTYDKRGNCTRCGLPGSGFVSDGVCMCADEDPIVRCRRCGITVFTASGDHSGLCTGCKRLEKTNV